MNLLIREKANTKVTKIKTRGHGEMSRRDLFLFFVPIVFASPRRSVP